MVKNVNLFLSEQERYYQGWEKVVNSRASCAAVTGGRFSQHPEQPRCPAEVSIGGASATQLNSAVSQATVWKL